MPTEIPSGAAQARPLTILVADDSGTVRTSLRLLLAQLGHEVETVADGAQAVAAVLDRRFDIVLMDVQMPVMGGLEASSRIRREIEAASRPRIIAISAEESPRDRARCLEAGMDDFLAKPILAGALTKALERWRQPGASVPEPRKLAHGLCCVPRGTGPRTHPELV
jgi:CheY-like chemotaxis protein